MRHPKPFRKVADPIRRAFSLPIPAGDFCGRGIVTVFRGAWFPFLLLAFSNPVHALPYTLGVIKSLKGGVEVTSGKPPSTVAAEPSSLIAQGSRFRTGDEGRAMLRLLPDNAFIDVRPRSAFTLKRIKSKEKRLRRLLLEEAEVVVGLKKKSEPVQCENAQTQATAAAGRFSCRSDAKGVATFLVQDGELSVYNRPKDLTVTVRRGQKAVSDQNGVKVSDATDAELDLVGFGRNTVEVDFVNPQTEDFTTLEVEYETNF